MIGKLIDIGSFAAAVSGVMYAVAQLLSWLLGMLA